MKNKAAALALGLVAMVGVALAALIPAAAKAAGPGSQYTQTTTTQTSTTPSTVTTKTGTTPTSTTPAITTATTATTATTPASTTPGTATTVTGATPASVPPASSVAPAGSPINVAPDAVGTIISSGVVVISNHGGNVVLDFHGTSIPVASGSTVTFASDGSMCVANAGSGVADFYGAPASVTSAVRTGHRRALASHGKITQFYFSTNTNNVVLQAYSIKTGITKYIKIAGSSYSVSKVSSPGHGRVWLNLTTPATTVKSTISSANFKFLGKTLQKLKTEKVKNLRTIVKFVAADRHVYAFVVPLKL